MRTAFPGTLLLHLHAVTLCAEAVGNVRKLGELFLLRPFKQTVNTNELASVVRINIIRSIAVGCRHEAQAALLDEFIVQIEDLNLLDCTASADCAFAQRFVSADRIVDDNDQVRKFYSKIIISRENMIVYYEMRLSVAAQLRQSGRNRISRGGTPQGAGRGWRCGSGGRRRGCGGSGRPPSGLPPCGRGAFPRSAGRAGR